MHMETLIRINKYLALKGICSRREADVFIEKGLVFVNGKKAKVGDRVNETDTVTVNTKAKENIKSYTYFAYHKERGIVTHSPEKGQKSIAHVANLPEDVYPLGRLDRQSRGLILMTNDGRITEKLLSPRYDHEKEYVVVVNKPITNLLLKHMSSGVQLEDFKTKPALVKKINETTLSIVLTEGKKHQIRRMCSALGYAVRDLKRVRIMNVTLGKLPAGQWRKLTPAELQTLLTKLGLTKAD